MHLKLRHLAVFHAVMEEGSVSRAADRIGLTQPAVSIALSRLEDMLGFPLFNRSKGFLVPLPEAKLLHADAETAILAFERFASHARSIEIGSDGLVQVGSIGSPGFWLMPEIISGYAQRRDTVEVQLQVRSSAQISHLVANGQIDIGIVEMPIGVQGITSVPVEIACVCIMLSDDPLAELEVVTPSDLAGRRLISVGHDHTLDRRIRSAFLEAGVPWSSGIACYFFSIIRSLVAKGTGVAVVDAINGKAALGDNVVWRPFEPRLTYDLAVITREDAVFRAPQQEFMDLTVSRLRSFMQDPSP